ncbi:hypothetical protein TrRE_jg12991 [Triparma retinervis]|uniref:Uncharacterized protein n=1 Tax=Triparma retinervis TaxID=2557542 RepID=A0A9W7AX95_9STRA|nr:hypothetical protein TrRE_jg12991 [Triparma retinervis]
MKLVLAVLAWALNSAYSEEVLFGNVGGIAGWDLPTAEANKETLQQTLGLLEPNDVLVFEEGSQYCFQGGVRATGLSDVVLVVNGVLKMYDDIDSWPLENGKDGTDPERVQEAFHFFDFHNVTITSTTGQGTIDGSGLNWWGFPEIGYLVRKENRPRLMVMDDAVDITIEHMLFKDSAYWTTLFNNVDGLVIRHSEVSARRPRDNKDNQHSLYDLTAYNTDGFDVTGRNVHIHDCKIWNQDDCIAVKDNIKGPSENMLFERIEASGMGLVIGSIGDSIVRNITFRDSIMKNTYKGIYLKFRDGDSGVIEDIRYENIRIENPSQWPIWIGPAQQAENKTCAIAWPAFGKCEPAPQQFRDILLKNITVANPPRKGLGMNGPMLGLIFGSDEKPVDGVVFEDVVFEGLKGGEEYYKCENVVEGTGVARGKTFPVPGCFKDETDRKE